MAWPVYMVLGKLLQDLCCLYKAHLKSLVRDFKMHLVFDDSQADDQNNGSGVLRVLNTPIMEGKSAMFLAVGELIE